MFTSRKVAEKQEGRKASRLGGMKEKASRLPGRQEERKAGRKEGRKARRQEGWKAETQR